MEIKVPTIASGGEIQLPIKFYEPPFFSLRGRRRELEVDEGVKRGVSGKESKVSVSPHSSHGKKQILIAS